MRVFFSFILFFILFPAFSQTEGTSEVLKNDTVPVQEAPESLKNLLQDIIEGEVKKTKRDAEVEIDGLLIDETKTKSGRDFFDLFYRDWDPPEEARNYSILVEEKPFRMNITMVEIYINETMVFQSFLQPRAEFIENLAAESVETTQMYLLQYEQIVRDMEGEERSGTGIF
ncbi:hypothetical protein KIH41_00965 [Litoribacter ruber]|uniref:Curli production assembly/transport component CsgE n=1 Tax=Litoribacter ruber TaxID=702568 RepID=A0AAP2CKS8_9BACT|nr:MULTISPECIES: CsgE family curli-type amyloid fiber assembly protein [Litoribacter]MBS9524355.1 hypothetical protein [Litoribacter alkaliphilus]MBT0809845.1 hypothetical protein [Litoribacter ruber]